MMRLAAFILSSALVLTACSPAGRRPQAGGQTNWLRACDSSDECGDLDCLCGACTASCTSDAACAELPGAACVPSSDEGTAALCGGQAPPSGMCLPRCEPACAGDSQCVAGVCVPTGEASVRLTIDASARHQTLVGFGASLAYADDAIVAHPDKAALYDLLFEEPGLDALRLRNRYEEGAGQTPLRPAREIVAAAAARLGRTPFLFMTSGTPPAALKANRSRTCGGDPQTCTLAKRSDGSFDYAGFAGYWRASLDAYADAGIAADYVSIQNNPNWVPPEAMPHDACRFLPEEGTTRVIVDAAPVDIAYPGYREALSAVRAAIADLPVSPRLGAPELSGLGSVSEYVGRLDASAFDALALHLYGVDAMAVDVAAFEAARAAAEQRERPVFQTEMRADGLGTAILLHHALTAGGASAYLQNDLVSLAPQGEEAAQVALVRLTYDGFEAQGPYYALAQYAQRTDPGWVRVDASSDSTELLGSAWLSPDESALTVVMVNPGPDDLWAELALPAELRSRFVHTDVTRTVFDGIERAAALGELPASAVVRVPGRAILTVALTIE